MKKSVLDLTKDLEVNEEEVVITFNNEKITVKGYLENEKRYNLINWVISQSRRNPSTNMLSQIDIDKNFDIAVVNFYTDYKFDIVNKNVANKTYDILDTNGFFDLVISAIPEGEYQHLHELMQEELDRDEKYCLSIAGNLDGLIKKMQLNLKGIDEVMDSLQDFDISKYENLASIADKLGNNNDKPNKIISLVEQKGNNKQ